MTYGQNESIWIIEKIESMHGHRLNDWEQRFIDNLSELVSESIPLSLKQRETLGTLWNKLS